MSKSNILLRQADYNIDSQDNQLLRLEFFATWVLEDITLKD